MLASFLQIGTIFNLYTFLFMQMRILDLILKLLPEDSKEPQTARILLYKLFYDQTDEGMTHFILSQIKSFDTHKQSKRFFSLLKILHFLS